MLSTSSLWTTILHLRFLLLGLLCVLPGLALWHDGGEDGAESFITSAKVRAGVNSSVLINHAAERPLALIGKTLDLPTPWRRSLNTSPEEEEDDNDDDDDVCQPQSPAYDALACFLLRKLRIGPLPPQTFKSGIFHLSLRDLVCSNVTVSNLSANATSTLHTAGSASVIEIQVAALGAVCTATYETMGLGGTLAATVGQPTEPKQQQRDNPTPLVGNRRERTEPWTWDRDKNFSQEIDHNDADAMRWTVQINSTTQNRLNLTMPDAVRTAECSTDLQVTDLAFGGSITSRLVNLFRNQIASYVTSQVNQNVCPALLLQVDPYVTQEIHLLESYLDPYLLKEIDPNPNHEDDADRPANNSSVKKRIGNAGLSNPDNESDDDSMDVNVDLPSFTQALRWINRVLWDEHLQGGFLRHWFPNETGQQQHHWCGGSFDGWNGILSSLLPPPEEALVVPIPAEWRTIEFDVNDDTHARIDIGDSLELQGMAHWTVFQLLRPLSSPSSASSSESKGLKWTSVLESAREALRQPSAPLTLGMHLTLNISSLGPPCSPQANVIREIDPKQNRASTNRAGALSTFESARLTTEVRFPPCESLVERVHVKVNASNLLVRADLELDGRRSYFQTIRLDTVFEALSTFLEAIRVTGLRLSDDPSSKAFRCLLHGVNRVAAANLNGRFRLSGVRLTRPRAPASAALSGTSNTGDIAAGLFYDDEGGNDDSSHEDLERDIDRLVNEVANRVVLSEYSEYVTAAILGLSHGPLTEVVNKALKRWLGAVHSQHDQEDPAGMCTVPDDDLRFPDWVNFSDIGVLHQLNWWLARTDVIQKVNDYLNCVVDFLVSALKEEFQFMERITNSSAFGAESSSLHAELRNFDILNAGSLRTIRVVQPERNGMYLSTALTYGTNTTFDKLPQLHLGMAVMYPPLNLSAQLNMSILVNDVNLGLGMILHYNLNALKSMLLQSVARHGECWVAPASDWVWVDPEGRLGFVEMSINATARALAMDQPLLVTIESQRSPAIREFCNNLVFTSIETIRDVLSSWTGVLQSRASRYCGDENDDEGNDSDTPSHFTSLLVIMAAVLLLAQPAVALIQYNPRRTSASYVNTEDALDDRFDLAQPLLQQANEPEPQDGYFDGADAWDELELLEWTDKSSLMDRHTLSVAYSVPVAVLSSIALILCSHLSTVASVDILLLFDGRSLSFPSVLDFNPSRAVGAFGRVGPNLLFFAIGLTSGVWPYGRLVLLMYAWTSSSLSPSRLAQLLCLTESMGKYVFAEVYVVILAMILFHYHMSVDEQNVLDIFVVPKFGMLGFWIGSVASLLLGHGIVFCHHRSVLRRHASAQWRRHSSVLTHEFTVHASASESSRRQLSRPFYGLLVAWLAATIVALWLGVSRDAFSVRVGGWLSTVVLPEFGADRRSFSLLTLARLVPSSVASSKSACALGLAAFFWATVLIVPLACLAILCALLVMPCSLDRQLRLLSWSEVTLSWSAIEVASGSILLTVLELPGLVNRAVQGGCEAWLQDVSYGSDGDDSSCFRLETSLEVGATFLIVSAVLHTSLVAVCLRLARQSVDERIKRCGRRDCERQRFLSDRPTTSLLQWLLRFPWMARCVLAPPHDRYRLGTDPDGSEAGPPLQGGPMRGSLDSSVEPWQTTTSFETEWQDAAERDPEWKEWKDATNVT